LHTGWSLMARKFFYAKTICRPVRRRTTRKPTRPAAEINRGGNSHRHFGGILQDFGKPSGRPLR
jgi:hypothetical protein